jgi:outer membrane protein TolC
MRRTLVPGVLIALAGLSSPVMAQVGGSSATPLTMAAAVRTALERRAEIEAARARTRAAVERPAIAGALADPMIASSIEHLPFMLDGADVSFTIEQQIPLSGIRTHRRESARAELARVRAEAERTALDVTLEAATAFLMLQERRGMTALVAEQLAFARDVIVATDARYAGGTGAQADVLRAEVEAARLEVRARGLAGDVRAAAVLLNASMGLDAGAPVPELAPASPATALPSWPDLKARLAARPELAAARADLARAAADVEVMRGMGRPMATIRTGPAYTMAEGRGWMGMVGFSVPLWRSKVRAGIAEAQAMRAMSEAELAAIATRIDGEAAAALSALESARDQQAALRANVLPRARIAVDPALAGYAAGRLPLVSVIESIQALWAVQEELLDAEIRAGLASARLARAIGSYEAFLP